MATRTIILSEEAYAALEALKREDQSFSDVILELLEETPPKTAGEALEYLDRHYVGVPFISAERRVALRSGRGRRLRTTEPKSKKT